MDTEQDNDTQPESAAPDAAPSESPTESSVEQPTPAALLAEIDELKARLESIRAERDELTSRLRTVSAAYKQQQDDVSATRKRLERLAAEKEEIRRGEVVGALFEPLQNLRRSKEAMERVGVDASHTTGLDMVIRQVAAAFEGLGMEEVPGKGSRFNPNIHEALTSMSVLDPALDNVVLEVYETGYRLGTRLIRPARVVIGTYSEPEPEPEPEPTVEPVDAVEPSGDTTDAATESLPEPDAAGEA